MAKRTPATRNDRAKARSLKKVPRRLQNLLSGGHLPPTMDRVARNRAPLRPYAGYDTMRPSELRAMRRCENEGWAERFHARQQELRMLHGVLYTKRRTVPKIDCRNKKEVTVTRADKCCTCLCKFINIPEPKIVTSCGHRICEPCFSREWRNVVYICIICRKEIVDFRAALTVN